MHLLQSLLPQQISLQTKAIRLTQHFSSLFLWVESCLILRTKHILWMRYYYLVEEILECGELAHRYGHLTHVVSDISGTSGIQSG